jgi:hypothetical protein
MILRRFNDLCKASKHSQSCGWIDEANKQENEEEKERIGRRATGM